VDFVEDDGGSVTLGRSYPEKRRGPNLTKERKKPLTTKPKGSKHTMTMDRRFEVEEFYEDNRHLGKKFIVDHFVKKWGVWDRTIYGIIRRLDAGIISRRPTHKSKSLLRAPKLQSQPELYKLEFHPVEPSESESQPESPKSQRSQPGSSKSFSSSHRDARPARRSNAKGAGRPRKKLPSDEVEQIVSLAKSDPTITIHQIALRFNRNFGLIKRTLEEANVKRFTPREKRLMRSIQIPRESRASLRRRETISMIADEDNDNITVSMTPPLHQASESPIASNSHSECEELRQANLITTQPFLASEISEMQHSPPLKAIKFESGDQDPVDQLEQYPQVNHDNNEMAIS